jgi:hypothetical protein
MYMELKQAYMSCLNTGTYQGEYHPASPVIDFVTKLAQINYQAVLDSGFLDMLLCMYVCNFSSSETVVLFPQQLTIKTDSDHSAMLEACTAVLEMLCQQADALAVVSAHPVCTLWPKSRALLDLFGRRSKKERYLQWREMGTDVVARRLVALPALLQLHMTKRKSDFAQLTDVCVDIVEFSRQVILRVVLVGHTHGKQRNCVWLKCCPRCPCINPQLHRAPRNTRGRTSQGAQRHLTNRQRRHLPSPYPSHFACVWGPATWCSFGRVSWPAIRTTESVE